MQDVITLLDRFSVNYAQRFGEGSQAPEAGVRINVMRVVSYVEHERLDLVQSTASTPAQAVPACHRECWFPDVQDGQMTAVYDYRAVSEGMTVVSPALIEPPRATYLIEPGWKLTMGLNSSAWLVKE